MDYPEDSGLPALRGRTPVEHPRRILLMVTGLSPQVVTETVYALAVTQSPPWIPTEVHLLTTTDGAERARLSLLGDGKDWFGRLRKDYELPGIDFDEASIHVLEAADGTPLEDIRTPMDNRYAADQITGWVERFTADPGSALHVSIAGGRKTMGYYLGYALSLFGRAQDRLSHVLVSPPFESCWDFFYPTPYSEIIETRDHALADTRNGHVTLAEIPFVRLRWGLDERLPKGEIGFTEAVAAAQHMISPRPLLLDLSHQRITVGDQVIPLPPVSLALLSVLARRAAAGLGPVAAPSKGAPDSEWARRFLEEYRRVKSGELDDIERTEKALKHGMEGDYFSSQLSKLRRQLKKHLGPAALHKLIDDGGKRPYRYRLALPAELIVYLDD